MAKLSPRVKTATGFAAAYAVTIGAHVMDLGEHIAQWAIALRADESLETKFGILRMVRMVASLFGSSVNATLAFASLLVVLGALVRTVSRARVRAGFRDPLDRMRAFMNRRGAAWVLSATPALWWLAISVQIVRRWVAWQPTPHLPFEVLATVLALPVGTAFVVQLMLARDGLKSLLAPTLAKDESKEATAEGFMFDAVAVTKETIGAVGGLAALSAIMATIAFLVPPGVLMRNPAFMASILAYVGVAVGGTLLFRRASRISVGLDGVFVSGSARRRFVPFSEIDDARPNGSSIELSRGSSVVLRLQLHGEDAIRRDALAERIRGAIKAAAELRNSPDVDFVKSAPQAAIERAADGAASYREAAPTRDKLWELLESPAMSSDGRKAAATALARASNESERVRLRVAAEQCAEPSVRARIYELLEDEEEEAQPALATNRLSRVRP